MYTAAARAPHIRPASGGLSFNARTYSDSPRAQQSKPPRTRTQQSNPPRTKGSGDQKPSESAQSVKPLWRKRVRPDQFEDRNIDEIIAMYKGLGSKKKATLPARALMSRVVTAVKRTQRQPKRGPEREVMDTYIKFAQLVASDMRSGVLKRNANAFEGVLRVLHYTKRFDIADEWWQWMRQQDADGSTLSVHAYIRAILIGLGQDKSLGELEELYAEALSRFPQNFQEYHFSANAVVPNREQELQFPVAVELLDAITKARMRYGKLRDAYLGLDTHFRLSPSSPFRSIPSSFVWQRPVSEAVTVHAMCCRGGQGLGHRDVTVLISKILSNALNANGEFGHAIAARQALSILYLEMAASASSTSDGAFLDLLITAITSSLKVKGILLLTAEQKAPLVDLTLECVRKAIEMFGEMGYQPSAGTFHAVIRNVAGFGGRKDVISIALNDARRMGVEPSHDTMRSVLIAAGRLGDKALVKESWEGLVEFKKAEERGLNAPDFNTLIKACRLSDIPDYAQLQFSQGRDSLPAEAVERLEAHMARPDVDPEVEGEAFEVTALQSLLEKVQSDLLVFQQKLQGHTRPLSLKDEKLPMTFRLPPADKLIADSDLRRIYDEMTAPGSHGMPEEVGTPTRSTTDIAYGDLRFENWKMINWLLAQALETEATQDDRMSKLDEATSYGLSHVPRMSADETSSDPAKVDQVRQEIIQLRTWEPPRATRR